MIKDLKDLFVPYEIAVQLKELGFNERGFGFYELEKLAISTWMNTNSYLEIDFEEGKPRITAPIFAQAFEFLLEKYNLYAVIIPTVTMHWTFKTMTIANGMIDIPPYKNVDGNDYNSSKETELASLEKLIEIVKSI